MIPATDSTGTADSTRVILTASRTSRAMTHSCTVSFGDEFFASMTGSPWGRQGQISTAESKLQVAASALVDGGDQLATYSISERFMRPTLVELVDAASRRVFLLRQKRIWSGRLVMLEKDTIVAEYAPDLFHSKYCITTTNETPQPVLLLSIWLAVMRLLFVGS